MEENFVEKLTCKNLCYKFDTNNKNKKIFQILLKKISFWIILGL